MRLRFVRKPYAAFILMREAELRQVRLREKERNWQFPFPVEAATRSYAKRTTTIMILHVARTDFEVLTLRSQVDDACIFDTERNDGCAAEPR